MFKSTGTRIRGAEYSISGESLAQVFKKPRAKCNELNPCSNTCDRASLAMRLKTVLKSLELRSVWNDWAREGCPLTTCPVSSSCRGEKRSVRLRLTRVSKTRSGSNPRTSKPRRIEGLKLTNGLWAFPMLMRLSRSPSSSFAAFESISDDQLDDSLDVAYSEIGPPLSEIDGGVF